MRISFVGTRPPPSSAGISFWQINPRNDPAIARRAWAASAAKSSYLKAQFRRLAARRGRKRALVAVGHSLLVIIYHVLRDNVEYRDLGPDYFNRLEPERLRRYLVKRLQSLGYDVALSPKNPDDCAA